MFFHPRRSASGQSLPSWLTKLGRVLLKNHHRKSKYEIRLEPIAAEVELLEANQQHSRVRFLNVRETIVANRHLPVGGNGLLEIDDEVDEWESSRTT